MIAERTVMFLALAGILYIVGLNIPLPGIDIRVVAHVLQSGNEGALQRLSIFALGILPLYTAFAIGELGRLIFADTSKPVDNASGAAFWKKAAIRLIALGITGLQAYGIATGLVATGLVRTDAGGNFVFVTVATFIGSTVLLLFLVEKIKLAGLRNGFWALWSVPTLLALPQGFVGSVELTRTGAITLLPWIVTLGYIALSVFTLSAAASLWQLAWLESGPTPEAGGHEPRDILVWPPVIASLIPGFILTLMALVDPGFISAIQPYLRIIVIIFIILLIPLFALSYARLETPYVRTTSPLMAIGCIIALIQIAIVVVGSIVAMYVPLPLGLGGIEVIGLTVAMLGLRNRPA